MGTGRPGGDYAVYGPAWGRLAVRDAGIDVAYRATGGASANVLLLEEDVIQLGLTTVSVAYEALNGTGSWTGGVSFSGFRALFPSFTSMLQIVSPRQTGITTLSGLAGQAIGIGPSGGSGAATVPTIFASIGVLPRSVVVGDYLDLLQRMLNGQLAACAFIGAPPLPAITTVAQQRQLSLIGFSEAEGAQVARVVPGMAPAIFSSGTFPGQSMAVSTVGTANIAVAAASLPNALAQAVTQAALDNQAALAKTLPAAATLPELRPIGELGIPFHPGAAQALRRYGLHLSNDYVKA